MKPTSNCPYCTAPITPKPSRGKKCLYCGGMYYVRSGSLYTAADARNLDESQGFGLKWMTKAEQSAWLKKEAKKQSKRQQETVQSFMAADLFQYQWISACHDFGCCNFCKSQDGRLIPMAECSADNLPPYRKCKNKDLGCRCIAIPLGSNDAKRQIAAGHAWLNKPTN